MDIKTAWASIVTEEQIKNEGRLLDAKYSIINNDNTETARYCNLYYIRSKDLFVIVMNNFETINDVHPIQVVMDPIQIDLHKQNYFGETIEKTNNNFSEYEDGDEYTLYQEKYGIYNIDFIKNHGKFLEKFDSTDIYYIEQVDTFVAVNEKDRTQLPYKFQDFKLRKKYKIMHKDERFQEMSLF